MWIRGGRDTFLEFYVQSRDKVFVHGCETFLPGPAWLLLNKTYKDLFLGSVLYNYENVTKYNSNNNVSLQRRLPPKKNIY